MLDVIYDKTLVSLKSGWYLDSTKSLDLTFVAASNRMVMVVFLERGLELK